MPTIFQNLKRIKHLDRKITKNSERLKKWCSHFDNEETQYEVPKLIQRGYNTDDKLKVVMNYDPVERDNKIDALENMLEKAEEILDNANIVTEIVT